MSVGPHQNMQTYILCIKLAWILFAFVHQIFTVNIEESGQSTAFPFIFVSFLFSAPQNSRCVDFDKFIGKIAYYMPYMPVSYRVISQLSVKLEIIVDEMNESYFSMYTKLKIFLLFVDMCIEGRINFYFYFFTLGWMPVGISCWKSHKYFRE